MKRIILFLLVMQASLIFGTQFEIVSELDVKPMHMGLMQLSDNERLDNNHELGALVIVNCGLKDVFFNNMASKISLIPKSGTYWVVMKQKAQYFVISKDGFANYKYDFPTPLKGGTVYEMTIDEKGGGIPNLAQDLNTVTFKLNIKDVMISYNNNAPSEARSFYAQYKLPKGIYDFKFAKDGYETQTQSVDISQSDQNIDINLKAGSSSEKYLPPALVTIDSDPDDAIVILNGQRVGITPYQGTHYAGEYTITIEKDLFYPEVSTFTLNSNETVRIPKYNLRPKYGIINIETNPTGATVTLDGRTLGQTPIKNTRIESGNHNLSLELATYQIMTKEFSIQDGDEVEFTEELIPNFSDVTIRCLSTEGALLTLNGEEMGILPYHNQKLLAGTYNLKISKELWLPMEEQIIIPPNDTITKEYFLTQNFGTLKISAPDSDIFLNKKKQGRNYIEIQVKPGNYQISAKRDKHQDATREITLTTGNEELITLEPQSRLGSVSILTVDKFNDNKAVNNANVYLDNKLSDKQTPALLSLLYGDYDLKITHPAYLDYQQKLTVEENQHREITISLETYSGSRQYKYDKLKRRSWITTGLTTLLLGGAITCNVVANTYYDEYENETNPTKALDYKDKTQQWEDIRDYTYYATSGVAVYSLYSWIRTAIASN